VLLPVADGIVDEVPSKPRKPTTKSFGRVVVPVTLAEVPVPVAVVGLPSNGVIVFAPVTLNATADAVTCVLLKLMVIVCAEDVVETPHHVSI